METITNTQDQILVYQEFESFILGKDHPCVMAQSSFKLNQVDLHTYEKFGSEESAASLLKDLQHFVQSYDFDSPDFRSFLAVFPHEHIPSEAVFEHKIWEHLSKLHALDEHAWDATVSSNPECSDFSFSLIGNAFYIVGMHPESSRMSRRSPYPTLVFNLHSQFELLREKGVYHEVRDKIRDRDEALQGEMNPVLSDFGEASEARQYSGKNVTEEWKCPFHPKRNK